MGNPAAEPDDHLIRQIANYKEGIVERLEELKSRGHTITVETDGENFAMTITKTVKTEEVI